MLVTGIVFTSAMIWIRVGRWGMLPGPSIVGVREGALRVPSEAASARRDLVGRDDREGRRSLVCACGSRDPDHGVLGRGDLGYRSRVVDRGVYWFVGLDHQR